MGTSVLRRRLFSSRLPASLALCLLAACASVPPPSVPEDPAAAAVRLQERREWAFAKDGVRFDNRLTAARLTGVTRTGAYTYVVDAAPETRPVNPSPWYGFRVAAERPATVRIAFRYPGFQHRYHPKLGSGDGRWRDASPEEFEPERDDAPATLRIEVGPQPLLVFAQPPLEPGDFEDWTDTIARGLPIERSVFGRSVQGRPLRMFEFGGSDDAPLLVVIGRQHPPENTGSQALFGFVETLAADTPRARAFRERVRTLVVPLVNPDGIVEGHWRGNLRGRDLNRDWGPFTEPETRALMQSLLARSEGTGRRVVFALDFHSTFHDVLYTVTEDPARQPGGALARWIAALRTLSPGLEEKPSPAVRPVFKNWAFCRFGAPAVTYEVGDTTPAAELDALSRHAAQALMDLLLQELPVGPVPACTISAGNDD
ncbi:M14 family metallopeptidase [Luteimonas sp. R10]|uniref:M14 family metallopeptidase n=1 Tax=Luteimonas sp. R10 TaxID=3108176 RepID=UPI00308A627D|nr:M14 family metallopeptidase [Luteimonas sp. R10]